MNGNRHIVCGRQPGCTEHPVAMHPDGRARLCQALTRSKCGSSGSAASRQSHPAKNMAPASERLLEAIGPFSRLAEKSGNSCLSRTLCLHAPGCLNPLPANRVQPKQPVGFPGFPGNFPRVYMGGGHGDATTNTMPKRQRTGAIQDASRDSAGVQPRGSVLQCDGPPLLFPAVIGIGVWLDSGLKIPARSDLIQVNPT